jgi:hypothetical protein
MNFHLLRRTFKWSCIVTAMLLAFIALDAHLRRDPYFFLNPKIPVSVPFAMDKAGNKAVIDFWAVPGNVDLDKTYMVSFSFNRRGSHDPMELFMSDKPKLRPKVSVRLWQIRNSDKEAATLKDRSLILAEGDPDRSPNIGDEVAYLYLTAWTGDQAYMLVASFKLQKYGHYRAEIEALQDTPSLNGVASRLEVTEAFNPGE